MLEFPRWKYALVLILSLVSVLYAVPNLFPQDPAVQISANRNSPLDAALQSRVEGVLEKAGIEPGRIGIEGKNLMVRLKTPEDQLLSADLIRGELKEGYNVALNLASTVPSWMEAVNATPMPLGLDLQGGVHFLMQVDEAAALDKRVNGFVDDIRALLRDNDIRYAVVDRSASGIRVELRDPADRERAAGLMGRDIPDLIVDDGADDKVLDARVRPESSKQILDNAIDQNLGTLRKRVNELGVTEPIVQRQGASRIVVQLAGVQDTAQAKKILGATATLEYRAVVGDSMSAAYDAMNTGRVPPDARLYYRRDRASDGSKIPVLQSKRVIASGD